MSKHKHKPRHGKLRTVLGEIIVTDLQRKEQSDPFGYWDEHRQQVLQASVLAPPPMLFVDDAEAAEVPGSFADIADRAMEARDRMVKETIESIGKDQGK